MAQPPSSVRAAESRPDCIARRIVDFETATCCAALRSVNFMVRPVPVVVSRNVPANQFRIRCERINKRQIWPSHPGSTA
jgi:hypothetical protein